jgi:hypothetical protein
MSEQLKEMIEPVKTWPEWRQEDTGYLLEMMEESGTSIYKLSDEKRDAVLEGLESPVISNANLKALRGHKTPDCGLCRSHPQRHKS